MLGTEKTPTLPYIIPSFSACIQRWKDLAEEKAYLDTIIEPGLEKLSEYEEELDKTPAYVLAMGMLMIIISSWTNIPLAIDPSNKFSYLSEDKLNSARRTFLEAVSWPFNSISDHSSTAEVEGIPEPIHLSWWAPAAAHS
jgi:hypothetical protein